MAAAGLQAIAVDQRGHGDSDWAADGRLHLPRLRRGRGCARRAIRERTGRSPVVVGASLGGIAGLLAQRGAAPFAGLVLVDVTPSINPEGVSRVHGFMKARLREGFASLEEAAEAVAAYLPERRRGPRPEVCARTCAFRPTGATAGIGIPPSSTARRARRSPRDGEGELIENARALAIPTLLVRGSRSDIVTACRDRRVPGSRAGRRVR